MHDPEQKQSEQLDWLLGKLRVVHDAMRDKLLIAFENHGEGVLATMDDQAAASEAGAGDIVFPIDRVSEEELIEMLSREVASEVPIVVVCEGLPGDGVIALPAGTSEEEAVWRIIVDPIDGTRGLMYQKRPGWILTGVAPNQGDKTSLADIELALMTEIPLLKQHLGDQLWALRGGGAHGVRVDRLSGQARTLAIRPSQATTIRQGFATVCRFFPGVRDVLAAIDDELIARLLGPQPVCGEGGDEARAFEDQYACTGGQIYGLATGQDRFVADLRPLMQPIADERQQGLGHCCHPYDICTALIAQEAGVVLNDPRGGELNVPLDTTTKVAWVGYANKKLYETMEPELKAILRERGLIKE
ncbi:inositol monophosphatase family protein [Adhaeretor mobilis]|uniref:Bifunctional inositol-1 monophosphatase/fructose-1,6-bisphosphatase n=1 Tax=Adhaeretor mobilis TaxID=1930276 RepID=A0A517MSI2_9BACT|nr:inositol monophosphatase family protein [Adhaeretor mobilis]QDS97831.1 bifunctional inositol-1 monophosphatase/fructose-1,6-bisphosphatase [Adhaeretor mobilis]